MSNQQVDVVTKQFEHQLARYPSEKRGARGSRVVSYLADVYRTDDSIFRDDPLHICEFTTAAGARGGARVHAHPIRWRLTMLRRVSGNVFIAYHTRPA